MAKKNTKTKKISLLTKEQEAKLHAMVTDLTEIASTVVKEYEDLDLSDLGLSELSSSLSEITQVHEDSPFLNELFNGDAWKSIVKNIPPVPDMPTWMKTKPDVKDKKDKKDDTE